MKDWRTTRPGGGPFVFVVVDGVNVVDGTKCSDGRLLVRLVGDEFGGGGGEYYADGEVGLLGESREDLGQLDCCDGANSAKANASAHVPPHRWI